MRQDFDKFARVSALRPAMKRARPVTAVTGRGEVNAGGDLAALLGATSERTRYGEHLVVRRWYSQPEPCAPLNGALQLLAPNASRLAADPEKWLFLDTETTGLAGGTGTYAFLVGVAWWDGAGLQVEQFFLRDFADEHSMLVVLAARLSERPVLVTFNGKSFDWPLLETRYRMTRSIPVPEPAAHLDLLHPARQVWRLRLGTVRLAELERSVLGAPSSLADWDRSADVRSEMIPHIYFDFLRGGSPVPLLDVLRHNQMDLRGLAAIATKMAALLDEPDRAEADALDLCGISRLVQRRGEQPTAGGHARRLYERALESGLPRTVDRAARLELAALAKRAGDYARAVALWEGMIHDVGADLHVRPSRLSSAGGQTHRSAPALHTIEACEQLAIYYDRHCQDASGPQRALEFTEKALVALRCIARTGLVSAVKHDWLRARLERRRARLHRRLATRPTTAELPARRRDAESKGSAPESNIGFAREESPWPR